MMKIEVDKYEKTDSIFPISTINAALIILK